MTGIRSLAVLLLLAMAWPAAFAQRGADIRYAAGDTVNVRSEPGGAVVDSLRRGEAVIVASSSGTWSQVDTARRGGVWVSTSLLCRGAGCWARPGTAPTRSSLAPLTRTAPASTYRPSAGGSCPCSGPNNCIGPRGGRYCITSGGNKRYR